MKVVWFGDWEGSGWIKTGPNFANYTFKHMDFEKPKKHLHKFMVWQSFREKGPAF